MKKKSLLFMLFVGAIIFISPIKTLATNEIASVNKEEASYSFIEEDLVGTRVENSTVDTSGPTPRMGGYLYKYVSHSESNKKTSYVKTLTVSTGITFSWSAATKLGTFTIGSTTSVSKQIKQYKNTSVIKSNWRVYDKYSGNYIRTETITANSTYYSYKNV
ncbi:LMxysn_1693 family intestinal colonization protein [Enterococcus sp. LJL120]|uniref:LMxysn_1693 family intestinal colonization protein n=1 Tax=Enterococcus sp. HY326 TaxID=2971265 RepID=UPI00224023EC|nr:hypothetical protein [Enterococcus sp. HY326]